MLSHLLHFILPTFDTTFLLNILTYSYLSRASGLYIVIAVDLDEVVYESRRIHCSPSCQKPASHNELSQQCKFNMNAYDIDDIKWWWNKTFSAYWPMATGWHPWLSFLYRIILIKDILFHNRSLSVIMCHELPAVSQWYVKVCANSFWKPIYPTNDLHCPYKW